MPRRLPVVLTLAALIVVPACSLGGSAASEGNLGEGTIATPTPMVVLGVGGGDTLPPGEFNIELELTYLLVPTVGTDQPVLFSTTIPLIPEFSSTNLTGSGEGEILEDITFTVGPVTAHNVADWIIDVDASIDPAVDDEPLSLRFVFYGQGYATIDETVQVGAHMDTGGTTYEHSLSLPLEEGASKSFDTEGWKDIQEWTVVLHLR